MRGQARGPAAARAARRALCAALAIAGLATALAAPGGAEAQGRKFTASNGASIVIRPDKWLGRDCGRIRQALREIDRTNYRRGNPRNINPDDRVLVQYEDKVSSLHLYHCQAIDPKDFRSGIGSSGGD